jgi:hypothetical protein
VVKTDCNLGLLLFPGEVARHLLDKGFHRVGSRSSINEVFPFLIVQLLK